MQTTSSLDTAAVDLRVTSHHHNCDVTEDDYDVTSGRPLDLTLRAVVSSEAKEVKLTVRRDATTPPDTPTSPGAAFKKTMLRRYGT